MKSSFAYVLISIITLTLVAGCSATPSNTNTTNTNINNTFPVTTNTGINTGINISNSEQESNNPQTSTGAENMNQSGTVSIVSDPNKLLKTTLKGVPIEIISSVKAARIANEYAPGKKAKTLKVQGTSENPVWDVTMDDGSKISINAKDGTVLPANAQ